MLALLLQIMPAVGRFLPAATAVPSASPVVCVVQWILGALAVAGTYHTVSAATAALVSASTINGTTGTRLSYSIKISDGSTRAPGAWTIGGQNFTATGSTTAGLPAGLSLSLSTGIISGTPTQAGTFAVPITAYEHSNRTGGTLRFTLTFNIAAGTTKPAFTTNPAGGTVTEGGQFTFSTVVTGNPAPTLQWWHGANQVTGGTSASLTLNPVKLVDAGDYKLVASNSAGSVTSVVATLVVNPAAIAPLITGHPQSVAVHPGEKVSLTVTASGTGPFNYTWKRGANVIATATTATNIIDAVTMNDAGDYTVTIVGPGGNATSNPATVAVTPFALGFPSLGGQNATLVLGTIPGRHYRVQAADAPIGPWGTIGEPTAAGPTTTINDSVSGKTQRFWRYAVLP